MTLADMLDPHWWTVDRMVVGFILSMMAVAIFKSLITD